MTLQEKILKRKLSKKEKHKLKIIEDRHLNGTDETPAYVSETKDEYQQLNTKGSLEENVFKTKAHFCKVA